MGVVIRAVLVLNIKDGVVVVVEVVIADVGVVA